MKGNRQHERVAKVSEENKEEHFATPSLLAKVRLDRHKNGVLLPVLSSTHPHETKILTFEEIDVSTILSFVQVNDNLNPERLKPGVLCAYLLERVCARERKTDRARL